MSSSPSPADLESFLDQPVNTISDPVNFRDLGGLAVDGGTTRSGFVFRSDDICLVSAAWASDLVLNKHVTAILDLRSESEVRVTGRGPLRDEAPTYHRYPLGGDVVVEGAVSISTPEALAQWYANLIESSAPVIVAALVGIGIENGATVVHCSAGKDRTGIFAACLLAVVGASDEVISHDYGRTSEVLDAAIGRLVVSHGISPKDSRIAAFLNQDPRPPVLTADAAVMVETLRLVASRHGSLAQFIRHSGLSDAQVEKLRARLVE
jgi:protein-tyrosine phosphatase